jgi:hypothetical protein
MMRHVVASFCLLACVSLGGCGDGKMEITGTVKIGDQLPDSGAIQFVPVGGGPDAGGVVTPGGKFTAEVMPGEMVVHVRGSVFDGEFEPDPVLRPGVMVKRLKDITNDKIHWGSDDVKVTIEKGKKEYDIKFDAAS